MSPQLNASWVNYGTPKRKYQKPRGKPRWIRPTVYRKITRRHTTSIQRRNIMRRDQHTCRYCGAPAEQVDHIYPIWWGGRTGPVNLVASCKPCNKNKSASLNGWRTSKLASEGNRYALQALKDSCPHGAKYRLCRACDAPEHPASKPAANNTA